VVVTVGGVASNGMTFTVTASGPSITSVNPASGLVAAPVTITGANFGATQGTGTVTFNGIAATATSWSATSITTLVPAGAATGSVVVTVGGVVSNGVIFVVSSSSNGAPYIPSGQGWHDLGAATQLQLSQDNNPTPAICPPDNFESFGYAFSGQCDNVFYAWNSGAWDEDDEWLILAAQGGHADYNSNEVYALKIPTMQLVRLNDPTLPLSTNGLAYIPDNGAASTNCVSTTKVSGTAVCPNARHTYDGEDYLPSLGAVMLEAGAVGPVGPLRAIDNWILTGVAGTPTWTRLDTCGQGLVGNSCGGQVTPGYNGSIVDESTMAYDSVTGDEFYFNNYGCEYYQFHHSTKTWTLLSTGNCLNAGEYIVSAVDPVNRKLVIVTSSNNVFTLGLTAPYTLTDVTSRCGQASHFTGLGSAPGIAYDTANATFYVAPSSLGNTVYSINSSTYSCSALTFSVGSGNSAINGPADPTNGGNNSSLILGKRFAYSSKEDAFIVAGGPFQHAFALRLQ
jgi:hypothetical protein